jgi:hypothetical protein
MKRGKYSPTSLGSQENLPVIMREEKYKVGVRNKNGVHWSSPSEVLKN